MSRSGYSEDGDYDTLQAGRWNAQVASALRGARGQKFLRDLVAALDAMPVKELVSGALETEEGAVCALGCLGRAKGVPLQGLASEEWDDSDWDKLSATFNIAPQLAREVMYINDDHDSYYQPVQPDNARRWRDVRDWAAKNIRLTPEELPESP